MTDAHLFISYRSTEENFALKLAQDLQSAGLPVWMDVLKGIKSGDDWIEILQNALNMASGGVACVSPEYVKSKYCRRELQRMDTLGKPVFPVLLLPVPKTDWPLEIQTAQSVDFVDWQDSMRYSQQLAALISGIKEKITVGLTASTERAQPNGVPLRGRTLEDEVESTLAVAGGFSSGLAERKAMSLRRQLELAYQQFDAATEQLVMTLNAADIPRLQRQVHFYEREAEKIETELRQLCG